MKCNFQKTVCVQHTRTYKLTRTHTRSLKLAFCVICHTSTCYWVPHHCQKYKSKVCNSLSGAHDKQNSLCHITVVYAEVNVCVTLWSSPSHWGDIMQKQVMGGGDVIIHPVRKQWTINMILILRSKSHIMLLSHFPVEFIYWHILN